MNVTSILPKILLSVSNKKFQKLLTLLVFQLLKNQADLRNYCCKSKHFFLAKWQRTSAEKQAGRIFSFTKFINSFRLQGKLV